MAKLTEDMKRVVSEQKLGFVATVSEDGTPNLSPKGTFIVLDDNHILFGEIRSPNTVKNLVDRPTMEVNFVDPFARKGFRAKGRATFVPRGAPEFDELLPRFAQWGELTDKFKRHREAPSRARGAGDFSRPRHGRQRGRPSRGVDGAFCRATVASNSMKLVEGVGIDQEMRPNGGAIS